MTFTEFITYDPQYEDKPFTKCQSNRIEMTKSKSIKHSGEKMTELLLLHFITVNQTM